MADDRAQLEELRRLDELQSRAAIPTAPQAPRMPGEAQLDPSKLKIDYTDLVPLKNATYDGKPLTAPQVSELMRRGLLRGPGEGIPHAAYDLGGKLADAGYPKLGYAANVAAQAIPAFASSYRVVGPEAGGPVARWLMEKAAKPATADVESGAAAKAYGTMLSENINPTMGGMAKAGKMAKALDDEVAAKIASSTADVDIPGAISRINPLRAKVAMQVNPESDIAAVEKAVSEFQGSPAVSGAQSIPVQLAQKLKSGTYSSLGDKTYGELGSASIEAQKQLARGLREEIAAKVPEVVKPLEKESALMNVRDVAMNRAIAESRNNPMGLAALRLDNPLSAMGFWADKSGLAKSLAARLAYINPGAAAAITLSNWLQNKKEHP